MPRHKTRRVVVGAQQRGQHLEEFLGSAAPRLAVGGVGRCARLICAVTGPLGSRLVRQIVPSPGI